MTLSIERCTAVDLDNLVQISKDTFIAAFETQNDPEDFKKYMDFAFSKEKLQSELENKSTQFYFVFDHKEKIGYIKLNKGEAQTDINDTDSLELERIYVIQSHQGRGIGEWLLQQVKQLAHKEGLNYVWLGVWEKNKAAIRFYLKHGFVKFGTHPYYIGKDKQTDWLMRLDV
ncbi:GNAT family N-acetyltransferase [Flagellimonas sp.]|uniref:GNAT family N-acetyltransferase n=1 Tax=Flagellimonas sp. TaxID=2058762 RepID=UPI003B5BA9F7